MNIAGCCGCDVGLIVETHTSWMKTGRFGSLRNSLSSVPCKPWDVRENAGAAATNKSRSHSSPRIACAKGSTSAMSSVLLFVMSPFSTLQVG